MATPNDIYACSLIPTNNGSANNNQSILIITADNTHDLEFFYPYYRFCEAGFRVDVATPKGGEFKGKMGMGLKQTKALNTVNAKDYALLYIPGGKAPAELKENKDALAITKAFVENGKPVSAICHGPQVLAAAKVIQGKRVAAWPEVESEIKEAGGSFMNEATVADGQFITARWPGDLPSHLEHTLQALSSDNASATRAA